MASYLLDTQYLIWFEDNNANIPLSKLDIIIDASNTIYFSQISLFEIAIKQQIGKLPHFQASIQEVYEEAVKQHFIFIPIENRHIINYRNIPLFANHRDPFDRLLIATAFTGDLTVITSDSNFGLYDKLIQIL